MARNKVALVSVLLAVVTAVAISQSLSQVVVTPPVPPAQPGAGADNTDRQARMEEFRKQMMGQLKDALGATDDEWKVIQPKIEKVQQIQRDAIGGAMRRMFRGMRPGGAADQPAADTPPADKASALEKATYALEKLLKDKDAKPEAVKAALADYRKARDASKADLEKAQAELKELLTVRQEAILALRGVLN